MISAYFVWDHIGAVVDEDCLDGKLTFYTLIKEVPLNILVIILCLILKLNIIKIWWLSIIHQKLQSTWTLIFLQLSLIRLTVFFIKKFSAIHWTTSKRTFIIYLVKLEQKLALVNFEYARQDSYSCFEFNCILR